VDGKSIYPRGERKQDSGVPARAGDTDSVELEDRRDWARRLLGGDSAALDALRKAALHVAKVRHGPLGMDEAQLADMLMNDAWVYTLEHGIGPKSLHGFLRALALNLRKEHLRMHGSSWLVSSGTGEAVAGRLARDDGDCSAEQRDRLVHRAISKLPEASRQLITRYYIDRHKLVAMSRELGVEPPLLSRRLQNIRRQLAQILLELDPDIDETP
jgi:DNA-directed RNA polymerase specialized sigma24 family protein